MEMVGAETRYHTLPDAEFGTLWSGKRGAERLELNKRFLAERELLYPVVVRWKDMPVSKDRTQLHDLWLEAFKRMWMAIARNDEEAKREAEAARKAGDEGSAQKIIQDAEEFNSKAA